MDSNQTNLQTTPYTIIFSTMLSSIKIFNEIKNVAYPSLATIDPYQSTKSPRATRPSSSSSSVNIFSEIKNHKNDLIEVVRLLQSKSNEKARKLARSKNVKGDLPLHAAMLNGKKGVLDLVKLLVKLYPEGSRKQNNCGNIPIHRMGPHINEDKNKAFAFLLDDFPEGAKLKDKDGWLPIHFAAWYGHKEIIRQLFIRYPEGLKQKNGKDSLPIHLAFQKTTELDAVRMLIDYYPKCLEVEGSSNQVPLEKALKNPGTSLDVLKLICSNCPQLVGSVIDKVVTSYNNSDVWLRRLAEACPEAFHISCDCTFSPDVGANSCTCMSSHPVMRFLERSSDELENWQKQVVSHLLRCQFQGQKHKKHFHNLSAWQQENTDKIFAELVDKLAATKAERDELETDLEEQIQYFKEIQEKHEEQLDDLRCQNKKQLREVIAGARESEEEVREQLAEAISLNDVSHELRRWESKLVSNSLDTWASPDLVTLAKSLDARLQKLQKQSGSEKTFAQKILSVLFQENEPSRACLLETISKMNSELSEIERILFGIVITPTAASFRRVEEESLESNQRKQILSLFSASSSLIGDLPPSVVGSLE